MLNVTKFCGNKYFHQHFLLVLEMDLCIYGSFSVNLGLLYQLEKSFMCLHRILCYLSTALLDCFCVYNLYNAELTKKFKKYILMFISV